MDFERYRMSANDSIERPLQSLDVFPPALYVMFTFVRHADVSVSHFESSALTNQTRRALLVQVYWPTILGYK